MTPSQNSRIIDHAGVEGMPHDPGGKRTETSIQQGSTGKFGVQDFATVLVFAPHAFLLTHLPTRTATNIPVFRHARDLKLIGPIRYFSYFSVM